MSTRHCRLFHVDAFTRGRFCGNPAIVVLDADELTEQQMQTIAAELRGETAFVLGPEADDHDMQVKFFTPLNQVAFVAHATVAAQYVRAKIDGAPTGRIRQRTGAGIVDVEVTEAEGDLRVALRQSPASLGPVLSEQHRREVLNALGISSPSLRSDSPLQIMVKGGTRLMIGVNSTELLGALKPNFAELARLTPHVGADGFFVFALAEEDGQPATQSRMFVPALGFNEDAVSGNAHGMLGVYMLTHGLMTPKEGVLSFRGRQGMWMRRPGLVDIQIEASGKVAQSTQIVGDAVIIFSADVEI